MQYMVIDFETYWDTHYSIKKSSILEYIRDPRFKAHGASVKVDGGSSFWVTGRDLEPFFDDTNWPNTAAISHNALFDHTVLHERYSVSPGFRIDTLGLCRALLPRDLNFDLDSATKTLGRSGKVNDGQALNLVKGLETLTEWEEQQLAEYAIGDAEAAWFLFEKLWPMLPDFERRIMNLVLRMSTEGIFRIDQSTLAETRQEIVDDRSAKLEAAGIKNPAILRSRDGFAALLRDRGVKPPRKISIRTGKETYAFSKQDPDYVALQADERVSDIIAARKAWTSNNAITRIDRIKTITEQPPYTLPVMLQFNGAHCVPGDTEVLTPGGWIRLDKWKGGVIAQALPNGDIIWADATRYVGPNVSSWVYCNSPYLKCAFTYGHRIPYFKHRSQRWGVLNAKEASLRNSLHLPTAGMLEFSGQLTPNQMRVIAMIQADGSYELSTSVGRRLAIFLKKPRKITRARQLLKQTHVLFKEQEYASWPGYIRFIICWRNLPQWLGPQCKDFDSWLLDSTNEARYAFIEELKYWDGWSQSNGEEYHKSVFYCTTKRRNAEWVQTLAHLTGQSASLVSKYSKRDNRKPLYIVSFSQRSPHKRLIQKEHWSENHCSQTAYCAQTQTGYWLARANGCIFITGNTGRFSGGGSINTQNLNARGVGSKLRKAIIAPPGYVILVKDAKQIELRMNMWFSGQDDVLGFIRQGGDPYALEASSQFKTVLEQVNKQQRNYGKVVQLGCGYQMGANRFRIFCAAGPYGLDPIYLTDTQAQNTIFTYRRNHPWVKASWDWLQHMALPSMLRRNAAVERGPVTIVYEGILLPNGLRLQYTNLRANDTDWIWGINGATHFIHGGIIQENVVQALTGVYIKECMLKIDEHIDGWVSHQVHDEIVCVVPENKAEESTAIVDETMVEPLSWAPGLPLEVEGGWSYCYER